MSLWSPTFTKTTLCPAHTAHRVRRSAAIAVLALTLAACNSQLYGGLSDREANAMVAVLAQSGIKATRTASQDGSYSINVGTGDVADAISILAAQGYPKQRFADLGDVFRDDGLVSTPFKERARFNFAISQELSKSISDIEGVLTARVHVVIPEKSAIARSQTDAATASVFIHLDGTRDMTARIPVIKQLVAHAVPGLTYENVAVAMFAADGRPSPEEVPLSGTNASYRAFLNEHSDGTITAQKANLPTVPVTEDKVQAASFSGIGRYLFGFALFAGACGALVLAFRHKERPHAG